jgi:AcrR family transcriptional regulator
VLLKERNRRMAASTKREDILAATLRLTAEKGIQGITTADIAKAANVGMGTIYNYFESKDVLLTALFDQLKVKFIETIVSNYNFDNDPPPKL